MSQANQPQLGFLGALMGLLLPRLGGGNRFDCPSAQRTPQRMGKHGDSLWGQTGLDLNLRPRVRVPVAKVPGHLQALIPWNFCGDESTYVLDPPRGFYKTPDVHSGPREGLAPPFMAVHGASSLQTRVPLKRFYIENIAENLSSSVKWE